MFCDKHSNITDNLMVSKLVASDQNSLVMFSLGYLIYVSLIKTKVG